MGLFDSATDGAKCPECGTWGAKKTLWKVKCVNSSCSKYDSEHAAAYQQNRLVGKHATEAFPHLKGKARPEDYSLNIRYKNFRGDELIYSADPSSGYAKNQHLVIRVAPTGHRITFRTAAIQNRGDVEARLPKDPQPNPQERKILNHHLRRGTTSRLFEEVREKYPDYQP